MKRSGHRVGGFRLRGKWTGKDTREIVVDVPVETGGGTYERRFRLPVPANELAYIGKEWLFPAFVAIEGALLGARDTVELVPERIVLVRGVVTPLNVAWGTFYITERAAESVYIALPLPEEDSSPFPVEVPASLSVGRFYHLVGYLSPRYYERQGIYQVRFKAREVVEALDTRGWEL